MAIATALVSCDKNLPASDQLVIGLDVAPKRLDPRHSLDAISSKISDLVFDGLLVRDKNSKLVAGLAKSWVMLSATEYRFQLRENVLFHDLQEFTAADVVFTYNFILDEKNGSPLKGQFELIKEVRAIGKYIVEFELDRPYTPFLTLLTFPIVSKRSDNTLESTNLIGTGPFVFITNENNRIFHFKRNDNYFNGRPTVEKLALKIIQDETVRVLELESGQVDIILNPITPDLLPRLSKNRMLSIAKTAGTNYTYIGLNLDDPILKNIKVREAIAHAIDRDSIIKYILKGLAIETDGLLRADDPFFCPELKSFDYDLSKAKKLLDEAGYRDPDGDGPAIRFKLEFATSQNELRKKIIEVLQYQLNKVGIEIVIRSYEWGIFFENIKNGDFQLYSLTWVGIKDPDIFYKIFHSTSKPPFGSNRNRYSNKDVDKLLEDGRSAKSANRKAIYDKIQKIIAEELPYISLWHGVNIAVSNNKRVENFFLTADERFKFVGETKLKVH